MLANTRSLMPKYGRVTLVDENSNAVDGIPDTSRLRLEKVGMKIEQPQWENNNRISSKMVMI